MRLLGPLVEGILEPAVFGLSWVKERKEGHHFWVWAVPTTMPS